MNAITGLYGSSETWGKIAKQFLEGSSQLTDLALSKIKQTQTTNDDGYYKALSTAVNAAVKGQMITSEMMMNLRNLVLGATQAVLKQDSINELTQKLQQELLKVKARPTEVAIVMLLADISCEIESKELFHPVQRQMTHLIQSYIMSYFKSPLIIFTAKDKTEYLSSINNHLKMRVLLAEKVRQAVFYEGALLHRVGGQYSTDWYKADDSNAKKDLSIEWHELLQAVKNWKDQSNTIDC